MVTRRLMLIAGAALALGAHTPYGQWVAYRQKHLLIGCHRRDLDGYAQAQSVAQHLAEHLPASRARVARAPAPSRLASLLATDQLDVALLDPETVHAMRAADGVFAAYGQIDLRALLTIERWVLVAHVGFRADHAWMVTGSLTEMGEPAAHLPVHPGAAAYLAGEPQPA